MHALATMFELYLARSDLRPASVRFKRRALKYFVEWFGDIPVNKVTPAIAEDYRMMLAKGRSKSSANGYLGNFKPFWVWLRKHNRIDNDPFDGLRLYRITESRHETFSPSDLGRMLRVASRLWRVRICLGLLGMRRGEVLNVTVRDINLSGSRSHILLSPKTATKHTWPWGIKDHAVRCVALPQVMMFNTIRIELHNEIVRRMEQLSQNPYVCLEDRYYYKLIGWQREGKLTDIHTSDPTGNFQRSFRALQKRAGVQLRRFHELRAAFITQVIEKCDLSRAADAAGHSNVQTTRRYHRYNEKALIEELGQIASECYQT